MHICEILKQGKLIDSDKRKIIVAEPQGWEVINYKGIFKVVEMFHIYFHCDTWLLKYMHACMHANLFESCLTLCDTVDSTCQAPLSM